MFRLPLFTFSLHVSSAPLIQIQIRICYGLHICLNKLDWMKFSIRNVKWVMLCTIAFPLCTIVSTILFENWILKPKHPTSFVFNEIWIFWNLIIPKKAFFFELLGLNFKKSWLAEKKWMSNDYSRSRNPPFLRSVIRTGNKVLFGFVVFINTRATTSIYGLAYFWCSQMKSDISIAKFDIF